MQKHLAKVRSSLPKQKIWYFIILFAVAGTILLVTSSASTPSVGLEAEAGNVVDPAVKVSPSAGASGNASVRFGPAVTTPPPTNAILFGSNEPDRPPATTSNVLGAVEAQLGRQFDIVRNFHSSWTTNFSSDLALANKGYIVHTSFKEWASWKQTSADLRNPASAKRAEVETLARNMQAQMPGPFFITIRHEPENDVNAAGGNSEQDYNDMFCAFSFVFKSVGNTKAKFAPLPIIDRYKSDDSFGAKLYPGDQCVDWNGLDVYNMFGSQKTENWRTVEQIMMNKNANGSQRAATGYYQWATTDFTGKACTIQNNPTCASNGYVKKLDGTTEPKQSKGKKPIVIGEWGTNEYFPCVDTSVCTAHAGDVNKKAAWFRQALLDFRDKMPQVKAIQYWGDVDTSYDASHNCFGNDQRYYTTLPSNLSCSTDLRTVPTSYTGPTFLGFKEISGDPYFYMTKGLTDGTASSAAAKKRFDFVNSLF